jgi:L-threonylcarbamoyladenylate synthase
MNTVKMRLNKNYCQMNNDIKNAVEILKKGGTILYPTETVWGIGCDATNDEAVKKLYNIKQKATEESVLVLVADVDMIYKYVQKVPEIAIQLIELSDKPLTIIFPQACEVAPDVAAADNSIGIRVVKHEYCRALINALKRPLVSTSANISGKSTPRHFDEISKSISEKVDYIVDAKYAGQMTGKPSSIIKIGLNNEVKIIR